MIYDKLIDTVRVRIDFKTPWGREAFITVEVTKNMLDNPGMMSGMIDERIGAFLKQHQPIDPKKLHG